MSSTGRPMTRGRRAQEVAVANGQAGDARPTARAPAITITVAPSTALSSRTLPKSVRFKEPDETAARGSRQPGSGSDYDPNGTGTSAATGGEDLHMAQGAPKVGTRSSKRVAAAAAEAAVLKASKASDEIVYMGSANLVCDQRKVKLVTEQNVVDKPSPVEEFPMRGWTIKLFMVDEQGNDHPADLFNKVVYNLHPSFEQPVQTFTKAPFACSNEGWGEFEMDIDCYYTEKTKLTLKHDLNFQQNRYEVIQNVSFKNPSQALQEKLRELGSLPIDEDVRPKKKGIASKKSSSQKYDFEKIAEALEKLEEDDLLKIIQMINDYKSPDTYIKSDVEADTLLEAGEFSIDLYTMPDVLTKMLWDHLSKKGLIA